jgi:Bacteriophage tail sheath protein
MPIKPTYPGVYVVEIPSGVHPIVGVSTSDTAFIDFFERGPINQAVRIHNFGDFVRNFGGLDTRSEASYAIQQFFLNGGTSGWVVRLGSDDMTPASYTLQGGSPLQDTLSISAANPGAWANSPTDYLQVGVDWNTRAQPNDPFQKDPHHDLFNLVVREVVRVKGSKRPQVVNTEIYRNLTMDKLDPNTYAVDIVNNASTLIQLTDMGTGDRPMYTSNDAIGPVNTANVTDGADGFQNLVDGSDGGLLDIDGTVLEPAAFANAIANGDGTGALYALDRIAPEIFNILCIPATAKLDVGSMTQVITAAEDYCEKKRAFLIVDLPPSTQSQNPHAPKQTLVNTPDSMVQWMNNFDSLRHQNAAIYYPQLQIFDPLNGNRPREVGASGTLAGIYARTDATRGVWKAPAGTEATLVGATLRIQLTDDENGDLNPLGINVLRNFPIFGNISWGARTLVGADQQTSEWKYIPVRRTALFLEESLYEGLKWVVFEPNDEPLWAQIRLNVGAFMQNLFKQGAFQGTTPRDAYLVKCDSETTTQNDIDLGIVNILVGFAPLKPAEFVIIQIQQLAGQIQV